MVTGLLAQRLPQPPRPTPPPVTNILAHIARNALLAMISFEEGEPLAQFFEVCHGHPSQAIRLILEARPVL